MTEQEKPRTESEATRMEPVAGLDRTQQENTITAVAALVAKRPGNMASDAERTRARQALVLQRERILSERTSSPHRRSALTTALASVEEQLSELGWMLHL